MKGLTIKQAQALEFIFVFVRDNGYPPSVREVGERFNITAKAAFDRIQALKHKGFIEIDEGKRRTIKIVRRDGCL